MLVQKSFCRFHHRLAFLEQSWYFATIWALVHGPARMVFVSRLIYHERTPLLRVCFTSSQILSYVKGCHRSVLPTQMVVRLHDSDM
jgi:hypothetical protein